MQLKYSNYVAFSHDHGFVVNNSGYIILLVKYQCKEYIYGTDNHYCQNTNIRYG